MGYKLIKHLESVNYNTKRFYLDNGEVDLPPIRDHIDIMPGSEAMDLQTKKMWILNSDFQWQPTPWRESIENLPDAPTDTLKANYVRYTSEDGVNEWKKVSIIEDVPTYDSQKVYVRKYNTDGTYDWVEGVVSAPTDAPDKAYVMETQPDGTNKWVELSTDGIEMHTAAEWLALPVKPPYSEITDSPFDGTDTSHMYIDH